MSGSPFGLTFSPPRDIDTREGPRRARLAAPTDEFWHVWRTAKDSLRNQGYKVMKEGSQWLVAYLNPETDTAPVSPTYPPAFPLHPMANAKGLLPYQIPHVSLLIAALKGYGTALDASDAGTGKTYCALVVARETGLTPCIVSPKSVVPAWERVCAYFGIKPYFVNNWESCKSARFSHGQIDGRNDEYTWKLGKTRCLLIFDEVHKAKGEYTQNAKLLIAAKRQGIPHLCLSATAADSPRNMRALGYSLDLHALTNFRDWSVNLGCYQIEYLGQPRGWGVADPVSAMAEIHRHVFPAHGSRMRISDLGDQFPETQITADVYPIAKAKAQNKAFDVLLEQIEQLKRDKKEGWQAASMVLNLRYRQMAEALKVDLLIELAKEGIENNLSILIFVNFKATMVELLEAFPEAATIHGGQTSNEKRQAEIDRFQADKTRVIIAQVMAGGVGVSLHDVTGRHARMSLICPTYSGRDLRQVLGRPHRAGGKSKSLQRIIYAGGTVEEGVCRTVAKRLEAGSSFNDGDLYEKDLLGVLEKPMEIMEDEDDEN